MENQIFQRIQSIGFCFIFSLFFVGSLYGQDQCELFRNPPPENPDVPRCKAVLSQATRFYESSMFRDVIESFRSSAACVPEAFPEQSFERLDAYRLLTDSWAGEEDIVAASCYARFIRQEWPDYKADYDRFGSKTYRDIFNTLDAGFTELTLPDGTQIMSPDSSLQDGTIKNLTRVVIEPNEILRVVFPPQHLIALGGDQRVVLHWLEDAAGTAEFYDVYRRDETGTDSLISTGLLTRTFTDTTVVNGHRYTYQVASMNQTAAQGNARAPRSNGADAIPFGHLTLYADGGDKEARLSWTPPFEGGGAYTVHRYAEEPGEDATPNPIALNLADTFFVDPGPLKNNNSYFYRISTFSGGRDTLSNVSVAVPFKIAPQVSLDNTGIANPYPQDSVMINVTVTDRDTNVEKVYLHWLVDGKQDSVALAGTDLYTGWVPALPALSTAEVWASASDTKANTSASATRVKYGIRPASPKVLAPVPGNKTIELNWQPVAGADRYLVYKNSEFNRLGSTGTETNWIDREVENGDVYTYYISAFNDALGESEKAFVHQVVPQNDSTLLLPVALDQEVNLRWTKPNTGSSFNIYRHSQDVDMPSNVIARDIVQTSYVDNLNLSNDTTYYYWIEYASSGFSNKQPATPRAIPPQIQDVHLTTPRPGPRDSIEVQVQVSDNDDERLNRVQLIWSVGVLEAVVDMLPQNDAFTDATLYTQKIPPQCGGCTIKFRIEAEDPKGNLAIKAGSPLEVGLARPQGVVAELSDRKVHLSWQKDPDAYGYRVFRRTHTQLEQDVAGIIEDRSSWTDSLVVNDTLYIYRIAPVSKTGLLGALSRDMAARPGKDEHFSLEVFPQDRGARLKWLDLGDGSVYKIHRIRLGEEVLVPVDSIFDANYTDGDLINGITYFYRVSAIIDGIRKYSLERSVTPDAMPPVIEDISFNPPYPDPTDVPEITVEVSDPDGNLDKESIEICILLDDTCSPIPISLASDNTYIGKIPGRNVGSQVDVVLKVRDQFDNTAEESRTYTVVPEKPKKVNRKGGECTTLTWQETQGADRYLVFRDTNKINTKAPDDEFLRSIRWKEVVGNEVEDCEANARAKKTRYAVAAVNSKGQFGKLSTPGDLVIWKPFAIAGGVAIAACVANFLICPKPGPLDGPPGYPGTP